MDSPLRLHTALTDILVPLVGADVMREEILAGFSAPPKPELGDIAFGCFRLARALRKSPAAVATELAPRMPCTGLVAEATAAGPYLNLRLNMGDAARLVVVPRLQPSTPMHVANNTRIMVEFSQPNTHKAFHVGHMRNLCLGDAIVRLLRHDGYDVLAANYLGDVGAHIAKCLWWYLDCMNTAERTPPATARGEWLGTLYAKATNRLDDWGESAKAGDVQAQAALAAAQARTTEILQKLEARDPELMAVWQTTRQWSLEEFEEIYAWASVHFDVVFYESDVDELGLKIVDEYLKKGVFVESEGAVGIYNDEVLHMPFFMLRKRDGTSLYATKDLALARLKFEQHSVDRSIYVVDTRQSDHFRHVFLTLKKMGFAQAEQCQHVPYEMVELPEGAMSTRRGTVVLFRALREQMLAHLRAAYLAKYEGEWPADELASTARMLALGAIKYGMLARDVNQKIVFDMQAWLNLEGNTGPYLQYAGARLSSILRKAEAAGHRLETHWLDHAAEARATFEHLTQDEERSIVLLLDGLDAIIHDAAQGCRPSSLCTYLHTLAKAANRFATSRNCHVLGSTGPLLQARLALITATLAALKTGLSCLGIEVPPRM